MEEKKNVFDLLQDLTDEMVRADGTDHSREREVDALAGGCGFVSAGFDGFAALFDFGFDVGAELIEFLAYDPLEFLSGGLEPVVGDLRQDAGFAAEPGVAELFPGGLIARAGTLIVEASAQIGEERCKLLGPGDAQVHEGQRRFVFVSSSW